METVDVVIQIKKKIWRLRCCDLSSELSTHSNFLNLGIGLGYWFRSHWVGCLTSEFLWSLEELESWSSNKLATECLFNKIGKWVLGSIWELGIIWART